MRPVRWSHWVLLLAVAEAIGMTAAAGAARASMAVVGDPPTLGQSAAVLGLAVAGGGVEGLALGLATYRGLGADGSGLTRGRWVGVTALVAMLAWAIGSAPASFSGNGRADDAGPPWLLVVVGAAVLGLVTGALLGGAQARLLRGQVAHHRRWVTASCLGWAPAMAIIFVGATVPDAGWSTPVVVVTGTVTGFLAGAVLGAISGVVLRSLDGPSVPNRAVLAVLASRAHRLLSGSLIGVRLAGRRSGRLIELPVQYAEDDDGLVVFPAHPECKQWWRNLRDGRQIEVTHLGGWGSGVGVVITADDGDFSKARRTYEDRWRRVEVPSAGPLVRIRLPDSAEPPVGEPPVGEPPVGDR